MSSELDKVVQSTPEVTRLTSEDRPEVSVGTVRTPQQVDQVTADLLDKEVVSKQVAPESVQPLSYWNEDIKKVFKSLPVTVRKTWINTVQKSENIHRRLSQQLKKDYFVWDQVNAVLRPQYARLKKQRLSLPRYVAALVRLEQLMLKDPKKFILDMLVHYKYKPSDVESWVEPYIGVAKKEREFAPLEKKINDLEYKLNRATAPQPVSEDVLMDGRVIAQELQYFFSQRDSQGKLLYPRFTEVAYLMPEMNAIYGTEDYESLYELACLYYDGGQMPDPKTYNPDVKYYSQNRQKTPYNPKSTAQNNNVAPEESLPDLVPMGPEEQSYEDLVKSLSEEWDVRNSGR
jgi:hypothetical protein